jgi:hypothetical protein
MKETGKPCIHYTELPDVPPDDMYVREWNTFRRELPRLLVEGNEGMFVLLKGTEIIGIFDTWDEGYQAGLDRYLLNGFLVQPIQTWQPVLRVRR